MKLWMPVLLGVALLVGCAAPALATPPQYQNDQQMDRERNTQAYNDGYAQGQADARNRATRNDQAISRYTKDDDTRAYRQGYDAGYDNIINNGAAGAAAVPIPRDVPHGDQQATQFGYQDGLAAGRADQMKAHNFDPHGHGLYKNGMHGYAATMGTKDQYKDLYREAFVKGYEDGYRGTGPR